MNKELDKVNTPIEIKSPSFADPALPLAVVVASTRWDEPPRMRHDVAKQLERFCNVVFVEFFPSQLNDDPTWESATDRLIVFRPKVTPVSPRVRANVPWVHASSNQRWLKEIEAGIVGFGEPLRLLFNFVYEFPEIMNLSGVVWSSYFCFDEFPKMRRRSEPQSRLKAFYQSVLFQGYENQIARAASQCFACHQPLYNKLIKAGGKVDYLYHACPYPQIVKPCLRPRNGPIRVGYGGHINYRLLDTWLSAVAGENDMELHLVGKPEKGYTDRWSGNTSVSLHLNLDDAEFFEKLSEMDVLIMPYDTEIPEVEVMTTNSKTFQYMAAGKPMVMSDMPHYIEMPQGIFYKARSADEFVSTIRKVFEVDSEDLIQLRQDTAMANSWHARGDQIWKTISKDVPL